MGQKELVNAYFGNKSEKKALQLTQLDAMVLYIKTVYEREQAVVIERPWLPPLEMNITSPYIDTKKDVGKIEKYQLQFATYSRLFDL